MSVEFPCPGCGYLLRTPAGTEGKRARCGQCQQVVEVPRANSASFAKAVEPQLAPLNPWSDAALEAPTGPLAEASDNPFAAPRVDETRSLSPSAGGVHPLRIAAGIGLLVNGGLMLLYSVFVMFWLAAPPDLHDHVSLVVFSIYLLACLTIAGLSLGGGLGLLQARNYHLAMMGAIASLMPCAICAVIGLPVGILAIVALMTNEVQAEFKLRSLE